MIAFSVETLARYRSNVFAINTSSQDENKVRSSPIIVINIGGQSNLGGFDLNDAEEKCMWSTSTPLL